MIAGTLALGATAAAAARDTVTIKLEGTAADAVAFKTKVTGTAGKGDRLILAGDEQHCASTEVKEATHKKTTAFCRSAGSGFTPSSATPTASIRPVRSWTTTISAPTSSSRGPKVTSPPPTIAVATLHYKRT